VKLPHAEPHTPIASGERVVPEPARGGDVGRVHVYRWGDGGGHFHVWFMPRPLGMLEASGAMLPLWEDVLPNLTDEQLRVAAEELAARMDR